MYIYKKKSEREARERDRRGGEEGGGVM